jgi:chaperonin cofactor prefoldin
MLIGCWQAQNSEAVENAEGTRDNRLNKNTAMIKDKFDRLQQSIQAAKNTAEVRRSLFLLGSVLCQ